MKKTKYIFGELTILDILKKEENYGIESVKISKRPLYPVKVSKGKISLLFYLDSLEPEPDFKIPLESKIKKINEKEVELEGYVITFERPIEL